MVPGESQTAHSLIEMDTTSRLACLETLEGYRLAFMDAVLWEPFVQQVCRERNWPCEEVNPGLAGTYPTFIVDQQRVVKFFGPLFKGKAAWQVELECGEILKDLPEIPTANLIAAGALAEQAGWFYLVFEYVPGTSIGQLYDRVAFEDKLLLSL